MTNNVIKIYGKDTPDDRIFDSKQYRYYSVGDLYVTNTDSKHRYDYKDVACIYDNNSQNVHMYAILSDELPKDSNIKCMESIIATTKKIREAVLSALQEKSTIYVYDPKKGSKGTLRVKDEKYPGLKKYHLFFFIEAKVNGRTYSLNFMRFFIDKDNKVNCILACPQFDRTIGKYVNKGGICYPTSYKGQRSFLSNMLEKSHDGFGKLTSYCYNPDLPGFDITEEVDSVYAENLAVKFIEFIKANEEWIENHFAESEMIQ